MFAMSYNAQIALWIGLSAGVGGPVRLDRIRLLRESAPCCLFIGLGTAEPCTGGGEDWQMCAYC